jgi:UDP-N-acetylglucosamine enolpyruvyl transferase
MPTAELAGLEAMRPQSMRTAVSALEMMGVDADGGPDVARRRRDVVGVRTSVFPAFALDQEVEQRSFVAAST